MAKRRHTPEQVIKKLREAEVAIAEGGTDDESDEIKNLGRSLGLKD